MIEPSPYHAIRSSLKKLKRDSISQPIELRSQRQKRVHDVMKRDTFEKVAVKDLAERSMESPSRPQRLLSVRQA